MAVRAALFLLLVTYGELGDCRSCLQCDVTVTKLYVYSPDNWEKDRKKKENTPAFSRRRHMHRPEDPHPFWRPEFSRCRPPDLEQLNAAGTATARH